MLILDTNPTIIDTTVNGGQRLEHWRGSVVWWRLPGTMQWASVLFVIKQLLDTPPNIMIGATPKSTPLTVTMFWPSVGPFAGDTDAMVGDGNAENRSLDQRSPRHKLTYLSRQRPVREPWASQLPERRTGAPPAASPGKPRAPRRRVSPETPAAK